MKIYQEINLSEEKSEYLITLSEILEKSTKLQIAINKSKDDDTIIELTGKDEDLTLYEASQYLHVSTRTISSYRHKYKLPSFFQNGKHLYKSSDLDKFVADRNCFIKNEEIKTNKNQNQ